MTTTPDPASGRAPASAPGPDRASDPATGQSQVPASVSDPASATASASGPAPGPDRVSGPAAAPGPAPASATAAAPGPASASATAAAPGPDRVPGSGSGTGSTRERVLARIRAAVADAPEAPEATRDYLDTHTPDTLTAAVADLLAENLADYRALVHRTDSAGLPDLLMRLLAENGSRTVLVPPGLPPHWLASADPVRIHDREASTARELDEVDSVVTGCALAIAETGTIVLDGGPDQGRRRISLVPDHHICVVRVPEQVVASVPRAMPRIDPTRPLTWISGPSATSDIELDRVEGVHGPRTLEVVLVED